MKSRISQLLMLSALIAGNLVAVDTLAQDLSEGRLKSRLLFAAVEGDGIDDDDDFQRHYFDWKFDYKYRSDDWNFGTIINTSSEKDRRLELEQIFITKTNFFDFKATSLSIGRKRQKDELTHWWDSDLEGIDIAFRRTLLNGTVSLSQKRPEYLVDESDDQSEDDDEEIYRLFGKVSLQHAPRHFLETRWHVQTDESDNSAIELEKFDGIWLGVRAKGGDENVFFYSAELIGQRGNATLEASADEQSAVEQDVASWASLLEVSRAFADNSIVLGLLWHRTSSGSAGSKSGFRPTGIGSMSYRSPVLSVSPHRYGDASRFELSNVDIKGVYIEYGHNSFSSLLSFTSLERIDDTDQVIASQINAPLVDGVSDLGYNLDVAASKKWDGSRFNVDAFELRLRWGNFVPGRAYGSADDIQSRIQLEFISRL